MISERQLQDVLNQINQALNELKQRVETLENAKPKKAAA